MRRDPVTGKQMHPLGRAYLNHHFGGAHLLHGTTAKAVERICHEGLKPACKSGNCVWDRGMFERVAEMMPKDDLEAYEAEVATARGSGTRSDFVYLWPSEGEKEVEWLAGDSAQYASTVATLKANSISILTPVVVDNWRNRFFSRDRTTQKDVQRMQKMARTKFAPMVCRMSMDAVRALGCELYWDPEFEGEAMVTDCEIPPHLIECAPYDALKERVGRYKPCKLLSENP